MITKTKVTVNNEALAEVLGIKPGGVVQVPCKHGVPTTREWRNRFKDAEIDDCITISQNGTKAMKSTKPAKGDE